MLPMLLALVALIIDTGVLVSEARHLQHVTDAAATSAATELRMGNAISAAAVAAESEVHIHNARSQATVEVHSPPSQGPYAGSARHVEVLVRQTIPFNFAQALGGDSSSSVAARSIAGVEPSTAGAALVVLDPDPADFAVSPLPLALPSLPSLVAGLEVLGVGRVRVDGAVLVNTRWGGVDESGQPVGQQAAPPYAVSCVPLLSVARLNARDIRVVGGVDIPANYGSFQAGQPSPLRANRLAVPDPLIDLPVPTVAADPINVSATTHGGKTIVGLPLALPTQLYPGVYDWIQVVSGQVVFQPGVYIIRGVNPATQYGLDLVAGQIQADGVMFYLTDTVDYDPANGQPDASDGDAVPAPLSIGTLIPSAVVNVGLLGSSFTPLNSPNSPFHGMMLFQRRLDRRPVVFVQENLLGAGTLEGTVYARWGHVILAGKGDYDARVVAGTMRIIALLDCNLSPTELLPPAEDVYLVE